MPTQASRAYSKASGTSLEILTDEEIKRFIDASRVKYSNGQPIYKNGQIFAFMLNTGLRVGEASAVKWCDYDAQNNTITVDASITQYRGEDGKYILEEQDSVKTRSSERVLKLNTNAINALPPKKREGCIFCTKDGKPLRPRNIQNILDSILKRAEISHKSTHVFRHTFASKLFEKGVDVKIVSELLGHSNINTTYNTYITLIKRQKARVMEAPEDMY